MSSGQGGDSEAVQARMLGTWSECFSRAFEKQGQFAVETTQLLDEAFQNSSGHL